jgi:hypothetical protein
LGGGSDFQLGWRPRPPSLGDFRLRLDPALEAQMRVMTGWSPTGLRGAVLIPPWSMLDDNALNRILTTPVPARPSAPLVARGAGPSTPRPGEVSDILRAVWAVPSVQHAANTALDRVTGDLSRGWSQASPGERGLVIGWGVVTAATLTPLLINRDTRLSILEFLEGKYIPVPGVDGLSLMVGPRGGGARWNNFLLPGLNISGAGRATDEGRPEWNVGVMFDVAEFARRR